MRPVFLSISYLLCEPFGISMITFIVSLVPGSISWSKFISADYTLLVFCLVAVLFFVGDGLVACRQYGGLFFGREDGGLRRAVHDELLALGRHHADLFRGCLFRRRNRYRLAV